VRRRLDGGLKKLTAEVAENAEVKRGKRIAQEMALKMGDFHERPLSAGPGTLSSRLFDSRSLSQLSSMQVSSMRISAASLAAWAKGVRIRPAPDSWRISASRREWAVKVMRPENPLGRTGAGRKFREKRSQKRSFAFLSKGIIPLRLFPAGEARLHAWRGFCGVRAGPLSGLPLALRRATSCGRR